MGEGGGGEGSGVLVFWGDHISHGFQGERGGGWGVGGQSSPIKCIEGTIKNSQPIGSGEGVVIRISGDRFIVAQSK